MAEDVRGQDPITLKPLYRLWERFSTAGFGTGMAAIPGNRQEMESHAAVRYASYARRHAERA
jgi:hypothetical protein